MEGRSAGRGPSREASAEEAEPPAASWSGDSGHVSQSLSLASGPWEDEGADGGAPGRDLPLLRRAAAGYAAGLLPGAGARAEVQALDASLDELLTRVDEFVGMLDMLRGDSSHVVSEGVPRIHAKATEMRRVYGKIDRLEAFVGMIGASVARMEEQVARAEAELGSFPGAFRKLLHTIHVPSLFAKAPAGRPPPAAYEPPVLFRTEDHFPGCGERPLL
ncbi:biogenesis of lysosome-related organelles complex 1 subunit 4 [Pipistrellus kuhlii]|uniref:Biogenesis of lysosomal organelles complex 1 subunit 4 n=1 Tax=Pipistrellus kuhlii TaxID=59472 RepID=A0A7J8AXU6_PIPKU|nr:biogenesis of lysosome-related organelles complex 1 subunit 4 [Pipistrellus kuhlii]KAF6391363.1 biogenesis of lysosomal organelles complex 1 subunit 4 [Pipistrellus kuhlii]